jgi:hypothetical protein
MFKIYSQLCSFNGILLQCCAAHPASKYIDPFWLCPRYPPVRAARTHLFRLRLKRHLIFQESRVISDQLGVMSERTSQADRAKKDQQIKVSPP